MKQKTSSQQAGSTPYHSTLPSTVPPPRTRGRGAAASTHLLLDHRRLEGHQRQPVHQPEPYHARRHLLADLEHLLHLVHAGVRQVGDVGKGRGGQGGGGELEQEAEGRVNAADDGSVKDLVGFIEFGWVGFWLSCLLG
jgi:hypothetical protein